MIVRQSKKLSSGEFEQLYRTPTFESMIRNKLEIFSSTKDDDSIFELVDHFNEHAQSVFYMSVIGNDNIWRVYFDSVLDMNNFRQLLEATDKDTEQTPIIESIVVNTTHDTE